MNDLDRSSSTSSIADSYDYVAHSDTEAVNRNRSKKIRHRRADISSGRILHKNARSRPNRKEFSGNHVTDEWERESLPVGHMPSDPMFVAVADYDPDLYSRSGRRGAEITLKEWDKVKIIGKVLFIYVYNF